MLERDISEAIKVDLTKKIVLLSGPRQSGKTTLAKGLFTGFEYLNFDFEKHRKIIRDYSWDRTKKILIFDELHKMKGWKRWVKGLYDVEGISPQILVTGSARLDITKKMGDSLAGRHFQYRLYPLDLKEISEQMNSPINSKDAFARLKRVGGFPEPFLSGSRSVYEKWKASHLDLILRQDLVELESITDIRSVEILIELLVERVGSTISYASLARDLSRDPKTIKRWIEALESLFIVFRLTPYSRGSARAIRKEPKIYFYDVGRISENPSAQIENITALSLLKEAHRRMDCEGKPSALHFIKDKDGHEVDFLWQDKNAIRLIEVNQSDAALSTHFKSFKKTFKSDVQCIQLVENLARKHSYPTGEQVVPMIPWLENLREA